MAPDEVRTRADLIDFVADLAKEAREHGLTWENNRLDLYLRALASWIEDSPGYYRARGAETPDPPTWAAIAEMLVAATHYE